MKNTIKLLCDGYILTYVVTNGLTKQHGLRILKGVKIVLKGIVLDFEEIEPSKKV